MLSANPTGEVDVWERDDKSGRQRFKFVFGAGGHVDDGRDGSPPRESSPPAVSRDGSREGSLEGGHAYEDAWSKSATSVLRGIGDFPSPTGAGDIAPLCQEYDAATSRFTGFLIDLDGTTYEPGGLIPGARRMLGWESNRGRCARAAVLRSTVRGTTRHAGV